MVKSQQKGEAQQSEIQTAVFGKQFSVGKQKDKKWSWQKEQMVRQSELQVSPKKTEPGSGKSATGANDAQNIV